MLTHQLIRAALLLWMTTISASYKALFAESSFRLERATSPLSTRRQNNCRRRSHVTSAVGYNEHPSPPPRHSSIGHERHSFETSDRQDRWKDEERLGIMRRFVKGGAASCLVSILFFGMGNQPIDEVLSISTRNSLVAVSLRPPHQSLLGSNFINCDMTRYYNTLKPPIGVGAAFALDTIDYSGKKDATTSTTAFTRGYPRSDVLSENNIAGGQNLVVQLDNSVNNIRLQSTSSPPNLKVLGNDIPTNQANTGATLEKSPTKNRELSPLTDDMTVKQGNLVQKRLDPSLQVIVNTALNHDKMVKNGISKATMSPDSNAKKDTEDVKSNDNALTRRMGKHITSRENCDEYQRTSFVDAISAVMNNAIVFSFGVGVGIVSIITRQKLGATTTSSVTFSSSSLPNKSDTENAITAFREKSIGMSSYLDGLSESSPLEFTDLQDR